MKKIGWFIFVMLIGAAIPAALAVTPEEAEQKAQEINKLVESDVIYSQEATKALYYQNIQIISLLGEVRDLLKQNLEKTSVSTGPRTEVL